MIGAGLPMLVYSWTQATLNHQLLSDPTVAVLAVSVSSVVIVAALLWGRTRSIPAWMSFALIATAIATTTAGGWELRSGSSVEVAYLAAGAAAPALALLAFFRPHWESLVAASADDRRGRGDGGAHGPQLGHHGASSARGDVEPHRCRGRAGGTAINR